MVNRSTIAIASSQRKSYEIPDWLKQMIANNLGWVALVFGLIMAIPATTAIVLGVHALPLEFIGVPGTDNSVGINIVAPILVAVLLLLAVRPLFRLQRRGWVYAAIAVIIYTANQIYLGHGITSVAMALIAAYLYTQTRRLYS